MNLVQKLRRFYSKSLVFDAAKLISDGSMGLSTSQLTIKVLAKVLMSSHLFKEIQFRGKSKVQRSARDS